MNILVILGHPDETSFNHAIAARVIKTLNKNLHTVVFHDLYAEVFDPVLSNSEIPEKCPLPAEIDLHCKEIASADGIVVIHPNWWGQPPAIVKGWIDRALRPGVAYQFLVGDDGEGVPVGLLRAKTAVVLNTSNTQKKRELDVFGDPLETLWKKCIFELCGVTDFFRKMFSVVVESTPQQRGEWLDEVEQIIDDRFPAKTNAARPG
jgi:NAD(P)H dehydrogenase (quinone)